MDKRNQNTGPASRSFEISLGKIFRLASGHWRWIALSGVLILLSTAVQLSLPLGVQFLFDEMLAQGDKHTLGIAALALLGLFLLRSVFTLFGYYYLHVTGDRIVTKLRETLHRHLLDLDLRFHSEQRVGELTSRLSSDTATIRETVTDTVVMGTIHVFQLVGAIVIMMNLNWRLGLIVLVIGPLTTVISRLFNPWFRRFAAMLQDHFAEATAVAQESLSAIQVVKAFTRSAFEAKRYAHHIRRVLHVAVRGARIEAAYNALLGLIGSSSTIAIFWFGGLEVIDGRLSAGALVAFLLYSQNVTQSIASLAQEYTGLHSAVGASRRVFELLETAPEQSSDGSELTVGCGPASITFDNLHFRYRSDVPVLRGIDLDVAPGEFIALVGPSGAGKSTLLALLSRFFMAEQGEIRVNGVAIERYRLESLREHVSIVSQDVVLFGMSIRENIRYGRLDATDTEVEAAARAANAHDFIHRLPEGYDTHVGERGVKLSGGERQRVSIARAILKQAPILILDEATSSVDAASESVIQAALQTLAKDRTTLAIAHRLSTVRAADRIVVMVDGQVAEHGSHNQLMTRGGRYAELVRKQFHNDEPLRSPTPVTPESIRDSPSAPTEQVTGSGAEIGGSTAREV